MLPAEATSELRDFAAANSEGKPCRVYGFLGVAIVVGAQIHLDVVLLGAKFTQRWTSRWVPQCVAHRGISMESSGSVWHTPVIDFGFLVPWRDRTWAARFYSSLCFACVPHARLRSPISWCKATP